MGPDRHLPPRIMFVEAPGAAVKFAYLVRIGDQAWAYAHAQEVHLPPDQAVTFPLDPSRIVEETNPETGEPCFAYRAAQ